MSILSIETSCDETAIALVSKNRGFKILSNIVASQVKIHEKFGGVYPALAKREHQRNLVPVLIEVLKKAKLLKKIPKMTTFCCHPERSEGSRRKKTLRLTPQGDHFVVKSKCQKLEKILEREKELCRFLKAFLKKYEKPKIDAIAVTIGPGLEPCLWVGVNFAKALGCFWGLPIISVNHLEAHVLANLVSKNFQFSIFPPSPRLRRASNFQIFPAICLIISGGHTQLILMKDFGKYKTLGETRDDAAGECFDKTARILGLGYPGGPAIAAEAAKMTTESCRPERSEGSRSARTDKGTLRLMPQGDHFAINLPRPMINQKNYDFSFSGLKTAVLYDFKKRLPKVRKSRLRQGYGGQAKQYIQEMAAEIQQAIIDVLIKKTLKAAKACKAKTIILGGGVAANKELRKQFAKKIKEQIPNTKYLIPDTKYCTDNAAMIGITAFYHLNEGENWKKIKANANLRL